MESSAKENTSDRGPLPLWFRRLLAGAGLVLAADCAHMASSVHGVLEICDERAATLERTFAILTQTDSLAAIRKDQLADCVSSLNTGLDDIQATAKDLTEAQAASLAAQIELGQTRGDLLAAELALEQTRGDLLAAKLALALEQARGDLLAAELELGGTIRVPLGSQAPVGSYFEQLKLENCP